MGLIAKEPKRTHAPLPLRVVIAGWCLLLLLAIFAAYLLLGAAIDEADDTARRTSVRSELIDLRDSLAFRLTLGAHLSDVPLAALDQSFARTAELASLHLFAPNGHVLYGTGRGSFPTLMPAGWLARARICPGGGPEEWITHVRGGDVIGIAVPSPMRGAAGYLISTSLHSSAPAVATQLGHLPSVGFALLCMSVAARAVWRFYGGPGHTRAPRGGRSSEANPSQHNRHAS